MFNEQYPTTLFYMIDILCNEKCSKCSHWKYSSQKSEDFSKEIIAAVHGMPWLKELSIVGGEPLIYKDEIINIVDGIKKTNIRTTVITNGVLADKTFIDSITDMNIHMVFSIDTLDSDLWEKIRGTDRKELVLSNFMYAHKTLNPEQLSIQSVLSKETETSVKEISRWCDSLGVFHSIQNYIEEGFEGHWTPLDINEPFVDRDSLQCIAYRDNLSIMPNGDIFTCFQQNLIDQCELPLGNIKRDKISDILNGGYIKRVRHKMKECNLPCKVLKCNAI